MTRTELRAWRGRTVLVTGAGGFIGSHVVERLVEAGANTRAFVQYNSRGTRGWLDRLSSGAEVDVRFGDLRDPDTLDAAMNGVEVVVHLGALIAIPYSYYAPESYIQVNVDGTLNACRAALRAGVMRFVHTSTSEVYGTARYLPMDEAHPLQAQSPYSASKIAADKVVEAFHLSKGLPAATIRPFNTFGPRQSSRAVIPTIITQSLVSDAVRLGSLSPTRDFTFVADTVDGILRLAASDVVGEEINLGTGREVSIGELVRTIHGLLGRNVRVEEDPKRMRPESSEVERLCSSNEKARTLLDWQPAHSLEDGLITTIQWFRENLEHFRVGAYTV